MHGQAVSVLNKNKLNLLIKYEMFDLNVAAIWGGLFLGSNCILEKYDLASKRLQSHIYCILLLKNELNSK